MEISKKEIEDLIFKQTWVEDNKFKFMMMSEIFEDLNVEDYSSSYIINCKIILEHLIKVWLEQRILLEKVWSLEGAIEQFDIDYSKKINEVNDVINNFTKKVGDLI